MFDIANAVKSVKCLLVTRLQQWGSVGQVSREATIKTTQNEPKKFQFEVCSEDVLNDFEHEVGLTHVAVRVDNSWQKYGLCW